MTDLVIPLTSVSIQQQKPSTKFGSLALIPVSGTSGGVKRMLVRGSLAEIPAGATISSAVVVVPQNATSTSHTLTLQRLTGPFSTSSTYGASGIPFTTTGQVSTTAALAAGALWSWDVSALMQSFVSGALPYYGFQVTTAEAITLNLRGSSSSSLRPELRVTYTLSAMVPAALNPAGGSVSKTKPTLTAQVGLDTTAIQVQVDTAQNATTPGFDSGTVTTTAGLLDLATTTYAGIASGTTFHRWNARNGLGWSGWSSWVPFSRTAWGTLTITSPTSTSEDPSPVVQATYSGTITSWQVTSYNATGAVVEQSPWTSGSSVSYGLTQSVGASGSVSVSIRDNVTRVVTPGDPDYLTATQAFTVAPSGTPAAFTALAATSAFPKPWVALTGTRAAIPDQVVIYRNNVLVARVAGADVFTGTSFAWTDYTAPPNVQHTYKVFAVVGTAWSAASSNALVTPTCSGIWLWDPTSLTEAFVLGAEGQDQSQPEVAVEHQPLRDGAGVIRRRLLRGKRQGAIAGTVLDAYTLSGLASETNLSAWADQDAGNLYRLVLGNRNVSVILGNILVSERPDNSAAQRVVDATLSYWEQ